MKNKILIAIIVLICSIQVWAQTEIPTTFTIGDLEYTVIDADKHEVSVKAAKNKPKGDLVIPSSVENSEINYTVTSICDKAFLKCSGLTSVIIPENVTTIGNYAFFVCKRLTTITIPNSVRNIGSYAFAGCPLQYNEYDNASYLGNKENPYVYLKSSYATTCKINNKCKFIGEFAFVGITSVVIPNSLISIGDNAFFHCYNLTSITIPEGVTHIGYSAFESCNNLKTVTIPNSVTSIGDNAFLWCTNTSITVPNAISNVGDWAFQLVKNINYSGNADYSQWGALTVNGIIDGDFVYADAGKTQLTGYIGKGGDVSIPSTVKTIGKYAFFLCEGLTSVTIPESVTAIEEGAFESCYNLTSITIPNTVTEIGNQAFYYCISLMSATIPNSIVNVGESVFQGCKKANIQCKVKSKPEGWNKGWNKKGGKVVWGA